MKKQKHFHSEQEILKAIERVKTERECKRAELNALLIQSLDSHDQAKADKISKAIARIDEVRLKKLGEALAAMRTRTFPFVDDASVVL